MLEQLLRFARPDGRRGAFEVAVSLALFTALLGVGIYGAAHAALWLTALVYLPLAGAVTRLFTLQHDCGHRSLFRSRHVNDWVGRGISLITLTPYYHWRTQHAGHHAMSGNLDRRGVGDVPLLTTVEYRARSPLGRWRYRLYRHPLVLFGIGPTLQFWVLYRTPYWNCARTRREWASIAGTNLGIAVIYFLIEQGPGLSSFFIAFFPAAVLTASGGVWLFYVQHHFRRTYWARAGTWSYDRAALSGASFFDLPRPLHWLTCNIGYHHIHHLCSRVPGYRLRQCFAAIPEIRSATRITIRESWRSARLTLWDETQEKLVTFREAMAEQAPRLRLAS